MNGPEDPDEYAETEILESDEELDHDPNATIVLGEEYRQKVESDSDT